MAKAKKLDPDHFNRQPLQGMKTSEQKIMYEGLRAFSDDEGILEVDVPFLALRIFGSDRRYKYFLSTMSALEKIKAVVKYRSDGRDYLVLPHHFDLEGRIQYFSPTEYPRPPKEFYVTHPHYNRGLQAHMDKLNKSAQGGNLPSAPPLINQRVPEGARGYQRVPEGVRGGQRSGNMQPLSELVPDLLNLLKKDAPKVYEQVMKLRAKKRQQQAFQESVKKQETTLNVKRSRNSEKTLNPGDGKHTAEGEIREKGESAKGEKGQEGEITLRRILDVCHDEQSKNFYKLVLARCPQKIVRSALIETECCIAERKIHTSPGRYFTGTIKRLAAKEGINLNGKKER